MSGRSKNRGVSLIEVLTAIGVVSIGLLALLAVFVTGTQSNFHGEQLGKANYFARKIMETIRMEGMPFTIDPAQIPPRAQFGINDAEGVFQRIDAPPFHVGVQNGQAGFPIGNVMFEIDDDGVVKDLLNPDDARVS